ncbi:hypothetical protein Nepgr_011905 [Nepenthes gracilis]|uniref:Uncharacterized protein n=1 Tax=Nepenthes gracilis TaxID=150966 RepID=A0AAD3XMP3_NEPGR|nr:hypothetical protein Nepgr_011905 [Nepenthes gracilis]
MEPDATVEHRTRKKHRVVSVPTSVSAHATMECEDIQEEHPFPATTDWWKMNLSFSEIVMKSGEDKRLAFVDLEDDIAKEGDIQIYFSGGMEIELQKCTNMSMRTAQYMGKERHKCHRIKNIK